MPAERQVRCPSADAEFPALPGAVPQCWPRHALPRTDRRRPCKFSWRRGSRGPLPRRCGPLLGKERSPAEKHANALPPLRRRARLSPGGRSPWGGPAALWV